LFAATWPAWPPISTPVAPSGKAEMMASAAVLPPAMSSTLTEQLEPSRALSAAGTFLLLCAVVRRLRAPNPLVDLPFLRKWNTAILGFGLYAFRFCLLATIVIIPQSLSVRGLDAAQFGQAVLWTAVAELALAVVAAQLLNKGLDSRLLMAFGFATMAFTCLVNADYTTAWAAENYFRSELLMGVGQVFAMVGHEPIEVRRGPREIFRDGANLWLERKSFCAPVPVPHRRLAGKGGASLSIGTGEGIAPRFELRPSRNRPLLWFCEPLSFLEEIFPHLRHLAARVPKKIRQDDLSDTRTFDSGRFF